MPAIRRLQASFTAGELDPALYAREDVNRYYSGAALMENVLVKPQGGFRRRPGLRHIFQADDAMPGHRLVPFAFNTEQTYLLLLTEGKARVFTEDVLTATVTGFPHLAPHLATSASVQSADTLLLVHPEWRPQRLRRTGSHASWARDEPTLSNLPTHDFGSGAEPAISATRGWPGAITFHAGRLYLGGFKSRPASLIGSKVGDFFNFDRGTALDDEGLYFTIDSDQVNAIQAMRSGRTLQVFTSGAEYAVTVNPPITPKNFAIAEQTRRGSKRGVPVVEVDGAQIFVQRQGRALREFLFLDVEQAYRADTLSLLASHLIRDPVDMAVRKGSSRDDADHVLIVNADGGVTVMTTLRSQEVLAFTRWTTPGGSFRSVAVLDDARVYFTVERAGSIRIERWDDDLLFDAGVVEPNYPTSTIGGLAHLEGQAVAVNLDGANQDPQLVAGGAIALPRAAASNAQAGLFWQPVVETLPVAPRMPDGTRIGSSVRIARVVARVESSGQFRIAGNPVAMRRFGAAPASPLDAPPPVLSGDFRVSAIPGWKVRGQVRIDQPEAGPLTVLGLVTELRL